ncbi:hypothetical protein B0H11DRAFT_2256506 [Mycena galericulata]|nr:hypothetical protein B0H11DRAFT_2256506 [Mycena galericulata]
MPLVLVPPPSPAKTHTCPPRQRAHIFLDTALLLSLMTHYSSMLCFHLRRRGPD